MNGYVWVVGYDCAKFVNMRKLLIARKGYRMSLLSKLWENSSDEIYWP